MQEMVLDECCFDDDFRHQLRKLIEWRRDVRRFRADQLPEGLLEELVGLSCLAPSVGLSEPWRFVNVRSDSCRELVRTEFQRANAEALTGYFGPQAGLYAGLKLAGLEQAPVQLAVFVDQSTIKGYGLGRQTMPETLEYSVVGAVNILWLAARAFGVGVGWVSIIEPRQICKLLAIPEGWDLVAYLCIGYPEEESRTPELQRAGWEKRSGAVQAILER